jgi:hypothetical protein
LGVAHNQLLGLGVTGQSATTHFFFLFFFKKIILLFLYLYLFIHSDNFYTQENTPLHNFYLQPAESRKQNLYTRKQNLYTLFSYTYMHQKTKISNLQLSQQLTTD